MKVYQIFRTIFVSIAILFFHNSTFSQKYKEMMNDNSFNFYDVVKEAESYFKTIDVTKKGSGYKQFMRWAVGNEYKYYPSGDRLAVDPEFVVKAYKKNLSSKQNQSSTTVLTNGWREIGPFAINNITGHYAAGMGRVEDFYVNPNNKQQIYSCSRSGGLWKTENEGATWYSLSTETLVASGVNSIAVNPLDFNHIYIALQNARNNYSYGIYESSNGGESFTETGFNPTNLGLGGLGSNFKIYTVKHHPTLEDFLVVGTSDGLYITLNNFSSWTKIVDSGQFIQVEFHPTNDAIFYAYNTSQRNLVYVYNSLHNEY
jgi:hypothetical protein